MNSSNGRTVNTLGHHQDHLQYLEMAVEPPGELLLGVYARKTHLSITVLGTTQGPMALAVAHQDQM